MRVWQFQTYPELTEQLDRSLRTLGELHRYLHRADRNEPMSDELSERVVEQYVFSLVTDGHVQHVDEGWLRVWYPLAHVIGSLPSPLDVARWVKRQAPGTAGALLSGAHAPLPTVHTSPRQATAAGVVLMMLDAPANRKNLARPIYDTKLAERGAAGAGKPVPFEPSLVAEMTAQLIETTALTQDPAFKAEVAEAVKAASKKDAPS